MTLPAGMLFLAAQTARPFAVLVRTERPSLSTLVLGVVTGALLVLLVRAVRGMRGTAAPRAVAPAGDYVAPARSLVKPTAKSANKARALAMSGASRPEIARKLGLSQDAVAFVLQRAGETEATTRRRQPTAA